MGERAQGLCGLVFDTESVIAIALLSFLGSNAHCSTADKDKMLIAFIDVDCLIFILIYYHCYCYY